MTHYLTLSKSFEATQPLLRAPYTVMHHAMHHAMRQFFEVCGAIHVMHHAHEACMKRIKLV